MAFEIESNGRVRFFTSKNGQIYFDDDGTRKDPADGKTQTTSNEKYNIFDYMTDGQFVKIAVVMDAATLKGKLYLNGVEKAEYQLAQDNREYITALNDGYFTTVENLCLGGDYREDNSQYFKGSIKNVALYSYAKTDAQISAGMDVNDDGLLFGFDLTSTINPLCDLSANERHIVEPIDSTLNGLTFTADRLYKIPYKLNVEPKDGVDEAITFEAEIYLPYTSTGLRKGAIIGTYTDDADVGLVSVDMDFEVAENGRVRFYGQHIVKEAYFDDDGKRDTQDNADVTNIYTYMGKGNYVKYVKIAVVVNITTKKSTLYLDGTKVKELSLDKAGTGDLKLPQYFYLGGDLRIGNGQYFKGYIRNLTLYSDVRTDAEIKATATTSKYSVDTTDENLIFAYDLTREGSDAFKDLSNNNYDIVYDPNEGKTFEADDCNEVSKPFAKAPKTVEATIYLPSSFSKRGTIIGNYGSPNGEYFSIEVTKYGQPRIYYSTGTQNDTAYGNANWAVENLDLRTYGDWVHLTFVYDDTDASSPLLRCYINGVEIATKTTKVYSDKLLSGEFTLEHRIGRDRRTDKDGVVNPAGANDLFDGYIKNITLYTDVRSANEVALDYANGTVTGEGQDSNLLAAYDFTKVADFKDYSGNGYDIKRQDGEGLTFTQDTLYRTEAKYSAVPYSFETWLYLPKSLTEGRGGVIFGNCTYGGDTKEINTINVEIHGNGNPRFYFNKGDNSFASYIFTKVDVRSDSWVHLAIVYDKANKLVHCYLNGELAQTIGGDGEVTVALYSSKVAQNSTGMCIGGDMRWLGNADKYNEMYFKGALKELAVYSDVRTAEEIKAVYEQGVNTADAGLISYYDLDLDEGVATIKDVKGKNNMTADWKYSTSGLDTSKYSYTFAFVGDTQKIVQTDAKNALDDSKADTDYAKQIYQWIADNAEKENIKYVFGLGDITETGTKMWDDVEATAALVNKEWEVAYNAMTPLRTAGVNYALIAGNHERSQHYTASPFANDSFMLDNITGYYKTKEESSTTWLGNYYINFDVGEHKYTLITLEYGAVDEILAWAGSIADANPDRRVIMTTHAYMFRDGTTLDKGDVVPPDSTGNKAANNGDEMWDKFVSQNANIILVVSGHDPYADIAWRQDVGVNGNVVSQFLIDPQGMSATTTGMVALFHFSADGSQVAVEYVSTHRSDENYNVYYRNQNQFTFNLYRDEADKIDAEENVYAVLGDADNYTAYYTNGKITNFTAGNVLADISGYKLVLNGNIGVKAFAELPSFCDTGKLYAKFTVGGEEFIVSFAKAELDATYGYSFMGIASAAQMTAEIKVELCYDGITLVSDTMTVKEYAKYILDNAETNAEYAKAKNLVEAMLRYGTAAQTQFNEKLDDLADAILGSTAIGDNTAAINSAAKSKVSGTVSGVTYRSTTLGLESETAIYHFFDITDTDLSKYTVTGADAVIIGNTLRVKIDGISAAERCNEYTVTVTYGGNTITVTANAMAYAKAVVNSASTTAALKTLVNALYEYNVAALAYNG